MSGRDIALCVLAALSTWSVSGTFTAALMWAREAVSGGVVVLYGISVALGVTAAGGWIWWAWEAFR